MKGLDDDINVATVAQDGTVRIWSPLYKDATERHFVRTQHFPCYGAGKLYADEYEDNERKGRKISQR